MRCPLCSKIISEFDARHHIKHDMTMQEFKKLCGINNNNMQFGNIYSKEASKSELYELQTHKG